MGLTDSYLRTLQQLCRRSHGPQRRITHADLATWEREIMLERQRECIARAKADVKNKEWPASLDPSEIGMLAETMGLVAIAKHLGIARSSVYRLLPGGT